jgi:hypothetical protein
MAAMATVLTEFADNNNSRTFILAGHTSVKPKLVIQKRKIALSAAASAENTVTVVYATTDVAGAILSSKISFDVTVRVPQSGDAADVAAALVVLRDIVASDEFTATLASQGWLS